MVPAAGFPEFKKAPDAVFCAESVPFCCVDRRAASTVNGFKLSVTPWEQVSGTEVCDRRGVP